jgi:hypothetical protein
MGQLRFAANQPAILANQRGNVVPFDARRRASHVRGGTDAQPRSSEGVVVRLPLVNEGTQKEPRAEKSLVTARSGPAGNETGFTTLDFVATAFLILSVFTAPALVWTLLRSASFG